MIQVKGHTTLVLPFGRYASQQPLTFTMSAVNILKFGISSPADTSPLQELKKAGYDASQILAVIGKTEGEVSPSPFCGTRY
jgi:hypothetical protein